MAYKVTLPKYYSTGYAIEFNEDNMTATITHPDKETKEIVNIEIV